MIPSSHAVEKSLLRTFGTSFYVVTCSRRLRVSGLTPKEKAALNSFTSERRRADWLKGRAALKELLKKMGRDTATDAFRWPHPEFSLTHSGGYAVAFGAPNGRFLGVGVDLETRPVKNAAALRFFLNREERAKVEDGDPQGGSLTRLWTVKEALYKANPDNPGSALADYSLKDPLALSGTAGLKGRKLSFRYRTFAVGNGAFLTFAVSL